MNSIIKQIPGFLCIDHIAMAVSPGELQRQIDIYQSMGFREVHREDVLGDDQVREVLLQLGDDTDAIQLLEPLNPASPVARQLEKNGGRGGVAHIAFRVASIDAAFAHLKQNGFNLIDAAPRAGSRGTTVFFVHPKTTDTVSLGYLLEIVQQTPAG
jgi:methylmalonyl-CoA/ethylmalonyl-CoA epimerase